jgi:drug/metabolite transporter (DMT)-like permease
MHTRLDAAALVALVICCASWGLNQVAMKAALEGIPPILQMGLRSLAACLLVYGWCRLRGIAVFGRDGSLLPGLVSGAFFGIEFILLYVGLGMTTASQAVVLLYLAPFVVAAGAHAWLGERLTAGKVAGLAVAFAGVVLVFSGRGGAGANSTLGDLLCVAAAVSWAGSTLTIKRSVLSRAPAEKTLLYQLGVSAVIGLVAAPIAGEPLPSFVDPVVAASFAYQVIWVGSITYVVWFGLVRSYPAALLGAATFMTPIFGVLAGVLLLGEPLTAQLIGAVALVAVGIWLVNRPSRAG